MKIFDIIDGLSKSKNTLSSNEDKIFSKIYEHRKDKDRRLNWLQMDRLSKLPNVRYETEKMKGPEPFSTWPDEKESSPEKQIANQPSTTTEKYARNRTLNTMRKYPNMISDLEKAPENTNTVFYLGDKKARVQGIHWSSDDIPSDSNRMINVNTGRGREHKQVARTFFHEAQHSKQALNKPSFYERGSQNYSTQGLGYIENPLEKDAFIESERKIQERTPSTFTPKQFYKHEKIKFKPQGTNYGQQYDNWHDKIDREGPAKEEAYYNKVDKGITAGMNMFSQGYEDKVNKNLSVVGKLVNKYTKHIGPYPHYGSSKSINTQVKNLKSNEVFEGGYQNLVLQNRGKVNQESTIRKQMKGTVVDKDKMFGVIGDYDKKDPLHYERKDEEKIEHAMSWFK